MKKIVVRLTTSADYFEVDCSTDEGAREMAQRGEGTLVTTRMDRKWVSVGKLPEEKGEDIHGR